MTMIVEGMAARIVGLEKRVTGLEATIVGRATAQTPLTKFQFFKYFQEHEGKTPTECETKWNEMLPFAIPEDMKDGEVRIRVCVDEYALHRNSKSRINEVRASLKEMKNPKAEAIQALKENLDVRQEGFNHKFFHEVGAATR